MIKIYVVGPSKEYANWMRGTLVNTMSEADLVVFTGGEDVSPELYKEEKHPTTYTNFTRDLYEKKAFDKAQKLKIPCIGICRGSQLLCVLSGGKLVQNQNNPYSYHKITVLDGEEEKEIVITSSHHQAAYPWNLEPYEYKVLGFTKNLSSYHKNGKNEEMVLPEGIECEIVYYPETNSLGIQGHPEWMDEKAYSKTFEYLHKLLDDFLNKKL